MFRKMKIRKIFIVIFWLLVWWLVALAVDNSILLVTPLDAGSRLLEFMREASFWQSVAGSLLRIAAGFCLGLLGALLLAGISFRKPLFEEILQPLINLIKTVPVASFVVLLLIWWGSSLLSVAICFLVVLPNIYINTLEGLKATDGRLLEMAEVFHMPMKNRFFYIYRPALRPFLESGMKLALGMCWKSGVAAEVIGMPQYSIGGQLYLSKIHLDTAGVLAWTAVVILLSFWFEKVILWATKLFFAWEPSVESKDIRKRAEEKRRSGNQASGKASAGTSIRLVHVDKSYSGKKVLNDLSVTYEAGNSYYLTSPSGSGKTTLLRVLCGLEHADGGEVEGNCGFSMVFQEDRLCEDYSALLNVAMVTGDRKGAKEALSKVLDEESLTKPCRELSGGMKRRVALVRAMEAASDAVLLDEPFTGMDAHTKAAAEEYIRERQLGRILVIATHI